MGFFLNYDSSWKDNLAFIYAGTQVFPLLPVQAEMESVSPWVSARGERFAFGAWFRRMLRHISVGKPEGPCEGLCLEYCCLGQPALIMIGASGLKPYCSERESMLKSSCFIFFNIGKRESSPNLADACQIGCAACRLVVHQEKHRMRYRQVPIRN